MPDPDQQASTRYKRALERRMNSSMQQALAKPKQIDTDVAQMGAPRLLPTIADPLLRVRPKKFPNESQKSYQQRLMENVHNAAKRGKLGTSA